MTNPVWVDGVSCAQRKRRPEGAVPNALIYGGPLVGFALSRRDFQRYFFVTLFVLSAF